MVDLGRTGAQDSVVGLGVDGFRHAGAVDGLDSGFKFYFIGVDGGQVLNAGFKL